MFQPLRERTLIVDLCQKIEIDDMTFHVKRFQADLDDDKSLMISIFGEKPNATTFNHNRIIKYEGYIWKPVKGKMSFTTLNEKTYFEETMSEVDIREFMKIQNSGEDEIVNLWVELTTMINPQLSYFFREDEV